MYSEKCLKNFPDLFYTKNSDKEIGNSMGTPRALQGSLSNRR